MLSNAFGGLRGRLLLLVLIAVLPAFGLILSTAFQHQRQAAAEAQDDALRLARLGALEQSRHFDGAHQLLTVLARFPAVLRQDPAACSRRLTEIREEFPIYTNLFAVRSDGDVFCSGLPLSTPLHLGDRAYFQGALKTRGFAVGEYAVGRSSGQPNIGVAHPAIDEAGTVRTVVVAGIGLGWLRRFTETVDLPRGSTVTVLDQDGFVLARYPDAAHWVGKIVRNEALFRTVRAAGTDGKFEAVGFDGVPRLYAFTRFITGPEPGDAYLVIGIPAALAYVEANRVLTRNLFVLAVVSLLAFGAAWIAADRLVLRNVRDLISRTRRLEAGDLSTRAGESSGARGELNELAHAFDSMAAQLEQQLGQLRESETRYRALVEQSLVGVYVVTGDTLIYMNQAGAEIFGYRPGEIAQLRLIELVHPEDRALVTGNVRARIRGDVDTLRYTFRGLRKDGTTIYCEVFGRRISFEGQPAVLGTLIDITDRVRGETELRRLNRALRVLSECNQALVRAADESELLDAICRVVVDIGGFRFAWVGLAEDDERKTVRPLARAGDDDGYLALVNASWAEDEARRSAVGSAIRTGQVSIVNDISSAPAARFLRDEARRRQYASVIALPLLQSGRPFGALVIYAAEPNAFGPDEVDLLTELSHDLAYGILALRTRAERQRMEVELEHQREARYQSDKLAAMGELLAGVAHELNNPLAVITGRSAIMCEKYRGQPLTQELEKVEQAAHRCARIVRNFLALARQQPLERRGAQLNQVVREAVELLAYPLRMENVEVAFDFADPLPEIWADPHQLHQVIVNLVTNAHHAMRQAPSPRRLTLTTRYSPAPPRVRVDVADTGPGIQPEIQTRIFEPFFTTKPPGEGTGLGLSLCRGIVEGHGGTIRATSQPGHGAVFQIELPVGSVPASGAEAMASGPLAPMIARSVLVVDDEPEIGAMLAELLTADGHRVATAANGAEALARLLEGSYDLILCDLRMPKMDGPTLYSELERRLPHLVQRIIFFTGDSLSSAAREFLDRTAAPRVGKPFNFGELRRVIDQVGRGSRLSDS